MYDFDRKLMKFDDMAANEVRLKIDPSEDIEEVKQIFEQVALAHINLTAENISFAKQRSESD